MPLTTGQIQVRELVMGPGTPYLLMQACNPFSTTVRADQGGARAWNHGSWSGVEWLAERVVPIYVLVEGTGPAGWLAAHQQLTAAFRPVGEAAADVEMRFEFGGGEYLLLGRPRMVEPDLTTVHSGQVVTQAAFVALDPLIYGATEVVAGPFGLPVYTGGLTVPYTVPYVVSGVATDGFADIVNTGTADAALQIRIDGPVVEPRVIMQLDGGVVQVLRIDITLATGEWLDIDAHAKTVLLNGTASRRGQASGDFPTLPPGTHRILFRAGEYNDEATLTATFRPTYW